MKLSLGAYGSGGHITNALDRITSRLVFLADSALELAKMYQDRGMLVIGRVSVQHQAKDVDIRFRDFAEQPLGSSVEEASILGTRFAERLVAHYPDVQVWQLYNESVSDGDYNTYKKLAAFETAATRYLHGLGKQSCVCNFGVGVVWPADWPVYFSDLLAEADYVGFHAYGSEQYQLMNAEDASWYALRYRQARDAMQAAGKRMPPVIFTECTTYHPWHGRFSAEQIADDLCWAGDMTIDDEQVVGWIGFQIGSPASQWTGFDLLNDAIINRISRWNQQHASVGLWTGSIAQPIEIAQPEENIPEEEAPKSEPVSIPTIKLTASKTTLIGNNFEIYDARDDISRFGVFPRRSLSDIGFIAIHHGGVPGDYTAESVAQYHIGRHEWPSAAYGFMVHYPNGEIEMLNDLDRATYSIAYRNHETLNILMNGDYTNAVPTDTMLESCRRLVAELQFTLGWFTPVEGHRNLAVPGYGTACPGDTWEQWREAVTVRAPKPFKFVLGFADVVSNIGSDVVGAPVSNEHRENVTIQDTTNGVLLWRGDASRFYRKIA